MQKHKFQIDIFNKTWDVEFRVCASVSGVTAFSTKWLGHKDVGGPYQAICCTREGKRIAVLVFYEEGMGSGIVAHEIAHLVDRMTPPEAWLTMYVEEEKTVVNGTYCHNVYEARATCTEEITRELWSWYYDKSS